MKVGVLGAGLMGSVIAWDLSRSARVDSVVVADMDEGRLEGVRKKAGMRKLSTVTLDLKDEEKTISFMKDFDVVSSALPHGTVVPVDTAAAKSGVKLVDIAFEDAQMELDDQARRSGALLVTGCGVAPGLGGILLAHGVRTQKGADEGHILVGGLPQKPQPPFGYKLVFSVVGLLREYIEEARVFRNGKVVKVMPFSTVEKVRFPPPVGTLEAFCTDGLASLVYTLPKMRIMDEKTLRWPGHVEKMDLLLQSGYFSREKVKVNSGEVSPLDVSYEVLGRKLREGDPKDMTVMRVEAKSRSGSVTFDMLDRYDSVNGNTSMGRTTGFTCSIVTQMIGSGEIKGKGVVPPENAVSGELVDRLLTELGRRGVKLKEKRQRRKR